MSIQRKIKHVVELSGGVIFESIILPYMKVQKGKCFIDIGANIGIHTVRIGKEGIDVYAFEPSPKTYGILCKNIKDFPNIEPFNYALGDKNTEGLFYVHEQSKSGFDGLHNVYKKKDVKEIKVKVRTLDSFDFKNIGLIKIDTEGNEYNILKGAFKTLKKEKPHLIIEVHSPVYKNTKIITSLLSVLGYNVKHVHEKGRNQLFIIAD